MFRWLNKQGVESSDGFVLQRMKRYQYHYIEDDHVMQVDVEPRGTTIDDYEEEIAARSLTKWQPPHAQETLSSERIARIKQNISAALGFMKIKHTFR